MESVPGREVYHSAVAFFCCFRFSSEAFPRHESGRCRLWNDCPQISCGYTSLFKWSRGNPSRVNKKKFGELFNLFSRLWFLCAISSSRGKSRFKTLYTIRFPNLCFICKTNNFTRLRELEICYRYSCLWFGWSNRVLQTTFISIELWPITSESWVWSVKSSCSTSWYFLRKTYSVQIASLKVFP